MDQNLNLILFTAVLKEYENLVYVRTQNPQHQNARLT